MTAAAMIARAKAIRVRLMFPANGRQSSELEVVSDAELRRRRQTAPRRARPQPQETWPVTVPLARRHDGRPIRTHLRNSTIKRLCSAVAQHYRLPADELLSVGQQRDVVRARQVLCYLARELTSLSYLQIGAALNREHTTILHAYRKIARALPNDRVLAANLAAIRRIFAAGGG